MRAGAAVASVEMKTEDSKAVVVMETMGDGVVTIVLVEMGSP